MAIDLLPLLDDTNSPPTEPGGEFVPPSASTHQEVADTIAEYLDSASPDLRPTSLPKQNNDWLRTIWSALFGPENSLRSTVEDIGSAVASGFDALGDATAAVQGGVDTIQSALGWSPATPTIIERIDAIDTGATSSWWGSIPFDPTNPEWVLVGTDTFTDAIHFVEEGHVYIIDAIPPITSRSMEIIDTEEVWFGLGWWAEMAGDYRGQRGFLDFEKSLAHNRGHLMRGCLVNFPKGGDGQISAYKYTPA